VEQFALNEDQKAVVQAVRRVVKESVEPRAGEIDATGEYPWDIKKLFSELGFLGAHVPVEYGGTGQGLLTLCLIIEEVAKSCASSSLIIADQELSLTPIMIGGSEEQKKRYLPKLATGEWLGAFCLTEPGAGSDAGAVSTKAVRDGDAWVLNGTKCFITNGGVAHVYVVFAKTDPEEGIKGISAFAVEADAPGVKVGKHEDKMGIRGSSTTDVIFEDCRIPAGNLLGSEGGGFGIAMATLDRTRPGVGAQGLGIAQGALDFAVEYMKERKQFGRPIAAFQGLQWLVADLATEVEAARFLLYKAAARIDEEGKDGRVRLSAEAGKLSAMAKLKASDVAMRVTTEAVQLLGGYGYMKDYPLERMMRDAKITQIYEGTNQIQRTVIGTRILS
jgi:alkylation response protein AidB-like acyl-CoA dehydrogenase